MVGRKKNDGRGRLGGRAKGTPNKADKDLKTWVAGILERGRDKFEENLNNVTPEDYIKTFMGLLNYSIPKLTNVSPKEMLDAEYQKLEELLENAPDEAISEIVERINRLKDESRRETGKN